MATIEYEICSFLSKFKQLCDFGLNANLSFNNSSGNISVNLQADIGIIGQYLKKKGGTPSHFRRRQRRKDARSNTVTQEPTISVNDCGATNESDEHCNSTESKNEESFSSPSTSNDCDQSVQNSTFEFGDGILEILNDVQGSNIPSIDTTSSAVLPSTTQTSTTRPPTLPISQREFLAYMENFNESFGNLLSRKLGLSDDQP